MRSAFIALWLLLGTLAGEWRGEGDDGTETLLLRPDGTGELDGLRLAWRADERRLIVRFDAVPTDVLYEFRLMGDALFLQDRDGETITYRRVGAAPATAPAAATVTATAAFVHERGFGLDLPAGWTATAEPEGAFLNPPDLASGLERYALVSVALGERKGVAEPEAIAYFDAQARGLAPFLARAGPPEPLPGEGVRLVYEGRNPDARLVRGTIHARAIGPHAVWIFAVGIAESVAPRDAAVRAMYRTLRAATPAPEQSPAPRAPP